MKSAFVSLGAGSYQMPLIEAAQEAGYHVIAVDRNPMAPGFASADECIQESITRPALVRRKLLAGANPIKALASRSFGRALISGAALSDALGIEGPDLRAARFFQDKRRYKAALSRAGVLVPRMHDWSSNQSRVRLLEAGSVVVRPPRGSGKLHVQVLHTARQKEALLGSSCDLLVEELVRGTEITVLGACHGGRCETLMITSKRVSKTEPLFAEILHQYPARIPRHVEQQVDQAMQAVADAAGLRTSALVAEFIFDGEKIWLVEAAPETGGEFLADWMFPALTGQSYFRWFVEFLTSRSMPAVPERRGAAVIRYILPEDGFFAGLSWPEADTDIFARRVLAVPGRVTRANGNLDRLAAFCLTSKEESAETLVQLADKIADKVDIRYEPEIENAAS